MLLLGPSEYVTHIVSGFVLCWTHSYKLFLDFLYSLFNPHPNYKVGSQAEKSELHYDFISQSVTWLESIRIAVNFSMEFFVPYAVPTLVH